MGSIETLKQLDSADYRKYGWWLMVSGKCGDLATTWYALESIPGFIEGNPLPALAYAQQGVLGLIALNGAAILLLTIVVSVGAEYLRRQEASQRALQAVYVIGYWLPGLFWLIVTYSNYAAVRQVQAALGF